MWQSLFPGPREAQLACLAASTTNLSPTLSIAGEWVLGQSGQNPHLPQAFQEIGSELTMTILVSEEKSSQRKAFLSGDLIGSRVRVLGIAKTVGLHGSSGI